MKTFIVYYRVITQPTLKHIKEACYLTFSCLGRWGDCVWNTQKKLPYVMEQVAVQWKLMEKMWKAEPFKCRGILMPVTIIKDNSWRWILGWFIIYTVGKCLERKSGHSEAHEWEYTGGTKEESTVALVTTEGWSYSTWIRRTMCRWRRGRNFGSGVDSKRTGLQTSELNSKARTVNGFLSQAALAGGWKECAQHLFVPCWLCPFIISASLHW